LEIIVTSFSISKVKLFVEIARALAARDVDHSERKSVTSIAA